MNSKLTDRRDNSRTFIAVLVMAMCLCGVQSVASGWQTDARVERTGSKSSLQWTQEEQRVQIGQAGHLQTFRIYRSSRQNQKGQNQDGQNQDGQNQDGSVIQSKVRLQVPGKNATLQVQNGVESLNLPGMNQIEIFARDLPHEHGVYGGQIVVELKKVSEDKQDRAIGFFAPNSWIESKNGKVELFAGQMDLSATVTSNYWIGVRCEEKPVRQNRSKSLKPSVLIVDEVVAGSAAEKAGIAVKDRIVSWNSKPLSSVTSLVRTIQANRDKKAKLGVIRDGRQLAVSITPQSRIIESPQVQTLIVPAAQAQIAQQKIEQLEKMFVVDGQEANRQFRVLLVGPGVSFGNKEIELHVNPEIHETKAHLKQLMDRVAEKKYGVFIKENSVTFKKATKHEGQLEEVEIQTEFDFEPHEIWETMQFGVKDKKFKFEQLAPRMIHRSSGEIVVTADNLAKEAHELAKKMKAGQIVFPNPVSALRQQLQEEIEMLKKENLRVRQLNLELKAALKELQKEVQQKKDQRN